MENILGIGPHLVCGIPVECYLEPDDAKSLALFRALKAYLEKHGHECDCDWQHQKSDGSCANPDHQWAYACAGNWAYNHGYRQLHVWNEELWKHILDIDEREGDSAKFEALGADAETLIAQCERELGGDA